MYKGWGRLHKFCVLLRKSELYLKAVKQTKIIGVQADKTACLWISIKCNNVKKILLKFWKTSHQIYITSLVFIHLVQRPKVCIFFFFLSSICTYCCLQRKGLTFILIKNTHVSVQIGTLHACRPTRRLHQLWCTVLRGINFSEDEKKSQIPAILYDNLWW